MRFCIFSGLLGLNHEVADEFCELYGVFYVKTLYQTSLRVEQLGVLGELVLIACLKLFQLAEYGVVCVQLQTLLSRYLVVFVLRHRVEHLFHLDGYLTLGRKAYGVAL